MALRLLLAHAGQVVSPAQIKRALWGDVHVTADSVPKCLSSLRVRLQPAECIQTVYKRGYRLLAEVYRHDAAHAAGLPRLAIPPFATDAGVPVHLGMGVAEETIARLSGALRPAASILARDSVFTLSQSGYSAQQIGEKLHADLVLTGTLRALPSHIRLRVEMIRVADGVQIWVEDLLVARDRIAWLESDLAVRLSYRLEPLTLHPLKSKKQVAHPGLSIAETGSESRFPGEWGTGSHAHATTGGWKSNNSARGWGMESLSISAAAAAGPEDSREDRHREAYELFLRGHHEWQTLERHRMQDALQHLTRALELDPALMAAKVDLVRLNLTQAGYGFTPATIVGEAVHRIAESVTEFDRQAEGILPSLGSVSFHVDYDLAAALDAFSRCAHLQSDTWSTSVRAMFALSRKRFQEAIALLENAILDDPFSPWLYARLGWALHLAGDAGKSVEQIRRGLSMFPDHDGLALYGSMILPFNGDAASGLRLAEGLTVRRPSFDLGAALHAYALACANRGEEALAIVERLQWLSRQRFVCRTFNPAIHVVLGNREAAIADLCNAQETRCPWFFQMLADPRLAPLHGHPEFEKLEAILPGIEAASTAEPEEQGETDLAV